jgi:hypothetical protein
MFVMKLLFVAFCFPVLLVLLGPDGAVRIPPARVCGVADGGVRSHGQVWRMG